MLKLSNTIILTPSNSSGGEGGTLNYNCLENKPSINGYELTGNLNGYDLSLVDTNTEELQFINSGLGIKNIVDVSGGETNNGNLQITVNDNSVDLATSGINLNLLPKTYFNENPIVSVADSFENASDDALMTKAQVLEATSGGGGGGGFPSDRMEDIDISSLITGNFEYTAPANGWFFIDQYTPEYNLYGSISYNGNWLGNFTVGTKIEFFTKDIDVNGTIIKEVEQIILEAGGEYQRIAVSQGTIISLSPSTPLNENSALPNAWFIYAK